MASFFGFGPTVDLEIQLTPSSTQKYVSLKRDSDASFERVLLFSGDEDISGVCTVKLPPGKRLEHTGIKLELIGQVGLNICFIFLYCRIGV